jgi:hypothetical protein
MLRLANNAITSFSHVPLQLAMYTGFSLAVAGLRHPDRDHAAPLWHSALTGQATTLVSVLFLGGIQLIFLGIIGEYLGRIYDEVKNRPLYLVADAVGFERPVLEVSADHTPPPVVAGPASGAAHRP